MCKSVFLDQIGIWISDESIEALLMFLFYSVNFL